MYVHTRTYIIMWRVKKKVKLKICHTLVNCTRLFQSYKEMPLFYTRQIMRLKACNDFVFVFVSLFHTLRLFNGNTFRRIITARVINIYVYVYVQNTVCLQCRVRKYLFSSTYYICIFMCTFRLFTLEMQKSIDDRKV